MALPTCAHRGFVRGSQSDGPRTRSTTLDPNPCAAITSWTTSLATVNDQPRVVLRVGVLNTCLDEGGGPQLGAAVSFTMTDTATGKFVSSSTSFAPVGMNSIFTDSFLVTDTPPQQTLTLTVTKKNGQLEARRSATVAEILQSVQQPTA